MYGNRSLSVRQNRSSGGRPASSGGSRHGFSLSSLRGSVQPELSKRLFRLIKSENNLINAHQAAARERTSIATQLSEWGEQTGDEAVSDVSDKVGVVLSEIGEQEDTYAHALDDSRGTLKAIRNIEKSVQPSRDNKAKITDEIAKLKSKEPESTRLVVLEQELVRAEAENLVAEAQLSNVTRQKLRESYDVEFAAIIERAEKQIILARHGQRLLKLLDISPSVPGDSRPAYEGGAQARQILNDAEDDLREWRPEPTDEDAATVAATARDSRQEREPELGQGQGQVGLAAGTYSSKEGSRRDSGYAPRGGQNYDPNQDYEDGSRAYDYGADPSAQGASSQMMSGGARPVEEREGRGEVVFYELWIRVFMVIHSHSLRKIRRGK
ncbi:Eisosome component PIL1-domain-containing protein [Phialemonium atrogriseum]|uniref:Eisosome component PIL1-domain-containing protein n=1 Tax=Phialemonium atrogriseum TaxID=1093897 RepID=A0AAJ0C206_9PEZI|nr:Eisosome component PIL1-domain-containing protein [Phialemonium atrogriseum]KAK1768445.1 Eisosome component PIL1-domain-containing protein [Phialemonium atrogriseum]